MTVEQAETVRDILEREGYTVRVDPAYSGRFMGGVETHAVRIRGEGYLMNGNEIRVEIVEGNINGQNIPVLHIDHLGLGVVIY